MRRFKKKSTAIIVGVLVVLVGAGAAFAYWTAGGSGTGTAATGTNVAITAVQTSTVTAMAPGDTAQSLNGTFTNTNTSPVYVATVTASISSVVKDGAAVAGVCDATDYTLAGAVMTVNAEAAVDDSTTWTGATIKFNNKAGVNQDACKNATVNLAYAIA
jgi:hypothetical protein